MELLRPALGPAAEVRLDDDLYGASAEALMGRLRAVNDRIVSLLLLGHNPGVQDLTTSLAGDDEALAKELLRPGYPTGALAIFELGSTTWTRLGPRSAHLVRLVLPRELPVEPDEHPG
jgi:phosphohistidine phosphatase